MRFMSIAFSLQLISQANQALVDHGHYRENIPRFRNAHNPRHEVYLGDETRLDCQTISKTPTIVEWFRNDKKMTDDVIDMSRIRKDNSRMILDIRQIDVSDQGMWTCRVFNSFGHIQRNFTIEVIDFCDYFLIPDFPRHRIPMECVCLWHYTKEAKRKDVDYKTATPQNCMKYASRMIARARKPFNAIPCFDDDCNQEKMPSFNGLKFETPKKPMHVTRVTLKDDDVPPHAGTVEPFRPTEYINANDDDDDDDDDENNDENEPDERRKAISPDEDLIELNVTVNQAPFFKYADPNSIINETHVLPAGRTLKLNCKSAGYPPPKLLWYKNNTLLTKESSRNSGNDYKFKRWSIELEDAVVADTGSFRCEAWNENGVATKYYNVIIVNRMRRPPIIVPNILNNQSVNVNDTAKFQCKVVSDLVPHIMWVRINKVNGSYHYYNTSAGEFMFNYTEMDKVENAHVHHFHDESSLTLHNVSLDDQGVYACLSGNSLGMTMANATLTVNDFVSINLLTGDEPKPQRFDISTIMFLCIFVLLIFLLTMLTLYALLYRTKYKKKEQMDDTVGLVAKKKRVIVNKKPAIEEEGWDPTASPYQIQIIEQTITKKEAGQRQRKRVNSENTVLSEYEVEPDPKWEIDRSKLELEHMLGEGAFGEVWRAKLKTNPNEEEGALVAVKKLKISAHEKELIDLVSEMETFKVIGEHVNVLRLIGCCTGSGPLYVVLELCRFGNLRDFLRAHRPKEEKPIQKSNQDMADYLEPRKISDRQNEIDIIDHLTQRHLVAFAYQVALGMDFMAKKKIIHRDLAARNVLVADNHVLKISDFGLSRDVHCNDYYRKRGNGRLPIKWMALEALDSHIYTIESDVWSFGILLWEIMTLGGTPYPTIAMPELYATLKEGYRMEAPHNCPEEVYSIMTACWQEKRENRPSFGTIVDYLEWMLVQSVDAHIEDGDGNERFYVEHSTASGPVTPMFSKKKKHRPLSMPVNLPSEVPPYSICDDIDDGSDEEQIDYHVYCNDNVVSQDQQNLDEKNDETGILNTDVIENVSRGYVKPKRFVQAISGVGVTNDSLDSAIGSPAWHSYQSSSNNNLNAVGPNASCLGVNHQYYNTAAFKTQYTYFNFDVGSLNKSMTRSKDSAIFDEYYPTRNSNINNFPQIYMKNSLVSTINDIKETIV